MSCPSRGLDRLDEHAPLLLVGGVLGGEPGLDRAQLGVGRRERRPGREPSEHHRPVLVADRASAARREHRRYEERVGRDHPRVARQHANHRSRDLVEHDASPEDVTTSEARPPEVFGEDHDVGGSAGSILFGKEAAAEECRHAEHVQELVRHLHAGEPFGTRLAAQVVGNRIGQRDCRELRLVLAPVEERAARRIVGAAVGPRLPEDGQAFRLGQRQRPEQHRVEQAVDGGVRADPEREREHRRNRERRAAREEAQAYARVLHELVGASPHPAVPLHGSVDSRACALVSCAVAELARRPCRGLLVGEPFTPQCIGTHLDVEGDFLVALRAHVVGRPLGESEHPLHAPRPHHAPPAGSITRETAAA